MQRSFPAFYQLLFCQRGPAKSEGSSEVRACCAMQGMHPKLLLLELPMPFSLNWCFIGPIKRSNLQGWRLHLACAVLLLMCFCAVSQAAQAPTVGVASSVVDASAAELKNRATDTPELPANSLDRLPDLFSRVAARLRMKQLGEQFIQPYGAFFATSGFLHTTQHLSAVFLYPFASAAEARGLPSELALMPLIDWYEARGANSHPGTALVDDSIRCKSLLLSVAGDRTNARPAEVSPTGSAQRLELQTRVATCAEQMLDELAGYHALVLDWHLALAARHAGLAAVTKAVEYNRQRGLPLDFMSLPIPIGSKHHVRTVLGLASLIREPGRYGARLPQLANSAPWMIARAKNGRNV